MREFLCLVQTGSRVKVLSAAGVRRSQISIRDEANPQMDGRGAQTLQVGVLVLQDYFKMKNNTHTHTHTGMINDVLLLCGSLLIELRKVKREVEK